MFYIIFAKFVKVLWVLIRYKKLRSNFVNVAIIESLSKDQQANFITCVSEKDFNVKFPVPSLVGKELILIQSEKLEVLFFPNTCILSISDPLLYLMVARYRLRIIFIVLDKIFGLDAIDKQNFKKIKSAVIHNLLNTFPNLDYFTTISAGKSYPIAFYYLKKERKYKTHVIHYSQNSIPIRFIDEGMEAPSCSILDSESLGDIHWIWTKKYKEFLEQINSQISFKAVGSITFQLNKKVTSNSREKIISIFDVVPQNGRKSFYTEERVKKFIGDIIFLKNNLYFLEEYEIYLKHKREPDPRLHSMEYINYVSQLSERGEIKVCDSGINPYQLISSSKLTLTIPFSSIAYIGKEVGTNSAFYDPYPRTLLNPIYDGIIPLIQEKINLSKYLEDNLK